MLMIIGSYTYIHIYICIQREGCSIYIERERQGAEREYLPIYMFLPLYPEHGHALYREREREREGSRAHVREVASAVCDAAGGVWPTGETTVGRKLASVKLQYPRV